jgi:hypothetical protein
MKLIKVIGLTLYIPIVIVWAVVFVLGHFVIDMIQEKPWRRA